GLQALEAIAAARGEVGMNGGERRLRLTQGAQSDLLAQRGHKGRVQDRVEGAGAEQMAMAGEPADARSRQSMSLADAAGRQRAPMRLHQRPDRQRLVFVLETGESLIAEDEDVVALGPPGDLFDVFGREVGAA